jgi:lipid-binding SYLF domain-containing protein
MKFRAAFCLLSAGLLYADKDTVERLDRAQSTFTEIMSSPDKGIPQDLLERAHCVVIVPSMKKGGFIVGAQFGKGVAVCRGAGRTGWTGPSVVKMEGGSLGAQIGAGEVDVVMLVMNQKGADKLMKSEFTLGGEGAVMAGPVGRSATAETDAFMRAEILSYSRSRGLFAGIALKGSTLRSDDSDNKALYGKSVSHEEILRGKVPPPAAAKGLIDTLNRYSAREKTTGE